MVEMKLRYINQKGGKERSKETSVSNKRNGGFRKAAVLAAAALGIAGCFFDQSGVRGLSENNNTNSNHNDASVIDVIDVNVNNNSNHNDGSIDVPNHPDAAIDASQPDSSVVDASVPDASYDASLPDAEVDAGGTVCQPFSETNLVQIQINDIQTVGDIDFRYMSLNVPLSPTEVTVDLECGTDANGDPVKLRQGIVLTETMMDTVDVTEIGHKVSMLNNWAVPNTLSLSVIVEPL